MKYFGLIGVFLLVSGAACPKPVPAPVAPLGGSCGIDGAAHDLAVSAVLDAARQQPDTEALGALDLVARLYQMDVVRCVVVEILPDLMGAPVTRAHLLSWLSLHAIGAP